MISGLCRLIGKCCLSSNQRGRTGALAPASLWVGFPHRQVGGDSRVPQNEVAGVRSRFLPNFFFPGSGARFMADIEHFDPRTRFIKLSYARNILLLIGSFLVGWNSWVLISLPQMVGREPEMPWFVLRGEILKQVGQEKDADPEKSVLALRNKDVKEFANYEAAARATINAERKILEATLLEKSPPCPGLGSPQACSHWLPHFSSRGWREPWPWFPHFCF